MTVIEALAGLLILLFPIGPWAMVVVVRGIRRDPAAHALRVQLVRFGLSSLQAVGLAGISLNYLLGSPLPRGFGFGVLVVVLLLISGPPAVFLVDYYRPVRRP